VVVSALGLVQLEPLREFRAIRRNGYLLGLLTLVSVLALGVLDGVLIGVLASMLSLVHALNHPQIVVLGRDPGTSAWHDLERRPGGATVPSVLVVRIAGPIYFANVQRVRRRLLELVDEADEPPATMVLELTAMAGIDVTALAILLALDRELAARGVTLRLSGLPHRPLELLHRSPAHAVFAGRIDADLDTALGRRGEAARDEP
jgi:SulP family sulfate permease